EESGAQTRLKKELSIYDSPSVIADEAYSEIGIKLDAFLVDVKDKKVYYLVKYEFTATKSGNWKVKVTAKGSQGGTLPTAKSWISGYKKNDNGTLSEPNMIANPMEE